MLKTVKKEEVQGLLGSGITDAQFEEALGYAQRKQQYIYGREKRPDTLQRWYLVKLTEEYVRRLAFSHYTLGLCRNHNMEKEHSASARAPYKDIHIVSIPAL